MFVLDKHCYDWYRNSRLSINLGQSVDRRAWSRTRQLPTCMDQTAVSGLGCMHPRRSWNATRCDVVVLEVGSFFIGIFRGFQINP